MSDTSGPVFPECAGDTSGLTKRELFAAMAMLRPDVRTVQDCTEWADLLLAELAKGGKA